MKTIGHLDGLRGSTGGAVGVQARPIAANHFLAGMQLQPSREAIGRAIWQEVNGSMRFKIDQNGSIPLPFAPSPVVNAHCFRPLDGHGRPEFQSPKNCVGTGFHAEPLRQARSSLTT